MKLKPQCIPCIFKARAREILTSNLSENEKIIALSSLMKVLAENTSLTQSTIILATIGFRYVKTILGNDDPYKEYKDASNKIALELYNNLKGKLERLPLYEKIRILMRASINANILDPGAPPFNHIPHIKPEQLLKELKIDETDKIIAEVEKADKVIYILDNAGEAIFDLALLKELAKINEDIIVMARGKPYQNDITVDEARKLGFGKYAVILDSGKDFAGFNVEEMSEQARREFKESDFIIAKGMANYESFLYFRIHKKVAHMLVAKCTPISSSIGVKMGDTVAIIKEW